MVIVECPLVRHAISGNEFLAAARNSKFGSKRANSLERNTCIIPLAGWPATRPDNSLVPVAAVDDMI